MEIQCGKEGMKSVQFNQEMGATASCTLQLLIDTIPEEFKGMKHGVRGDAWFGNIQTANEVGLRGFDCILQVKKYHSHFP
jgi:hypothetical protein